MRRFVKFLLSLPFLLAAGALALYALSGFVLAPWWIKRELPHLLDKHLSAMGSVGDIAINPFKLTVDIRDFAVTESGGKHPAIAFDRLFVDFEASSLFKRAWTFADITLERPRIQLESDASGALNLAKLKPRDPQPKKPDVKDPNAALPRVLLGKFLFKQGLVTFTDQAVSTPATARLEPIEFELRDLSTLPDQQGNYTLAARLPAGGTLAWRGTVSLSPFASAGQIELASVRLATLWQFVRDKLMMDEPGGTAALTLKYDTRYAQSTLQAAASDTVLRLTDISLKQKGANDAVLTAGEVTLTGGTFNLAQRNIQFAELTLARIVANTLIDGEGKTNWARFAALATPTSGTKPAPASETPPAAGTPWRLGIDAIKVADVKLGIVDQVFVRPVTIDVARAGLTARLNASFGAQTAATIDNLAVDVEDIRVAESGGKTTLVSLASAQLAGGHFDLAQKAFSAQSLKLTKPVTTVTRDAKGVIHLAEAFARKPAKPSEPSGFMADIGVIELAEGNVSFQDQGIEPALALDVHDIRVLAKNVNSAGKGTLPFEASLQIKQGGTLRAQGTATPEKQRATLKIDVRNVSLMPLAALMEKQTALKLASGNAHAAGQLDWSGQGNTAGLRYNGSAGVDNFRLAHGDASSAAAADSAKPAGALRVQGTASTQPPRASLKLEARNIALAPFNSLLAQRATLKLASGSAHAAGQLQWRGDGTTPGVRYTGNAGVDALQLNHEANGERLFAWQELLAEGIELDTANKAVRIDDVRIGAPAGKIAIARDRSTNLTGVLRNSTAPAASATTAPEAAKKSAPPTPAADDTAAAFTVNVERVHVRNGELDFSDQSLVLPFAAVIREFGGTVTGLSSRPGTRASLKLEGRVDEFGQAQVGGTINPFEPKVFTDLAVTFRNVAMSPLTPYSATFAGRRIASGRLSLDLQYKLNNSQLQGENKVLLEQFTLGERVESPTAINLPLDLAIALLTDSNGRIDLSVPVRGNVDAPQFAYGHLVWQAIRTVLTNIVTAPFRALASLFGGGADKVDTVSFEAGRAQLAPPEREKLSRVAGVLKQRPQLRLVVEGRYDSTHDGAALRTAAARRALAERQGIKLVGADDPALANFDNAKTQRTIELMLEERAGAGSVDKFKVSHEKSTGKPVSRVNPALALIGRGSPDRQFYEALFNQLVALQPLDKSALANLATQRGTAIAEYLKTTSGLDSARLATKPGGETKADKATDIAAALSLEAHQK